MRRLVILLLATTAMASLSVGSAASLRVTAADLTSGRFGPPNVDVVVADESTVQVVCDSVPMSAVEVPPPNGQVEVTEVVVSGIDPGCVGLAVQFHVSSSDAGAATARGVFDGSASQTFELDDPVGRSGGAELVVRIVVLEPVDDGGED